MAHTLIADVIREETLLIGGEWVPGNGGEIEVENPATEETIGVAYKASADDAEAGILAAQAAFPRWAATPVGERVALLRRLGAVIRDRADRFAEIIHREQGSPPALARKLHVDVPLAVIDQTADALDSFEFTRQIGHSLVVREPVGVVAAITPWNLPLHQVVVKVVPSLAAGATVVHKPAELTPLTAFELARAISDAGFPPGTFNLVPGSGKDIGSLLTRHAAVDHVSFTGSTPVGAQVAAAAAQTIKKVTLELGGKSASVILADVDDDLLTKAVKVTVANCYLNAGQTCTALSRLIVPADRLSAVEQVALAAASKYAPGERLGPLISATHRVRVLEYTEGARSTGGRRIDTFDQSALPDRGYYARPAVFSDVDPKSDLAQDEIFGPVLSILAADDDQHAIDLANDSMFGLGGAVWALSEQSALQTARQIRTGQIDINGAAFNARAPFGGYKRSGLGREIGDFGIEDVLEIKSVQR